MRLKLKVLRLTYCSVYSKAGNCNNVVVRIKEVELLAFRCDPGWLWRFRVFCHNGPHRRHQTLDTGRRKCRGLESELVNGEENNGHRYRIYTEFPINLYMKPNPSSRTVYHNRVPTILPSHHGLSSLFRERSAHKCAFRLLDLDLPCLHIH